MNCRLISSRADSSKASSLCSTTACSKPPTTGRAATAAAVNTAIDDDGRARTRSAITSSTESGICSCPSSTSPIVAPVSTAATPRSTSARRTSSTKNGRPDVAPCSRSLKTAGNSSTPSIDAASDATSPRLSVPRCSNSRWPSASARSRNRWPGAARPPLPAPRARRRQLQSGRAWTRALPRAGGALRAAPAWPTEGRRPKARRARDPPRRRGIRHIGSEAALARRPANVPVVPRATCDLDRSTGPHARDRAVRLQQVGRTDAVQKVHELPKGLTQWPKLGFVRLVTVALDEREAANCTPCFSREESATCPRQRRPRRRCRRNPRPPRRRVA